MVCTGKGAENGILIKGGEAIVKGASARSINVPDAESFKHRFSQTV